MTQVVIRIRRVDDNLIQRRLDRLFRDWVDDNQVEVEYLVVISTRVAHTIVMSEIDAVAFTIKFGRYLV